jgi:hypothetical protein
MKKYEDDLRAVRPDKQPLSEEVILAKIAEHKKKRKDAAKRSKANKAARAAAGQGGVAGMKPEVLHAERRLRQAKVNQTTRIYNEVKQGGDQSRIDSAEIAMLEAKRDLAQLAGGGNAMGKKKKTRVKLPLSEEHQDELKAIVNEHTKNVREVLQEASTHSEYSANLHAEFVRFAQAKLNFYERLPDSPAKPRKVALLQKNYDRIAAKPADDTPWPLEVFDEFKRIMMNYRQEVDQIRLAPYKTIVRRDKRKELLEERTDAISALLVKNNISTKAHPRRNVRAQGIVGG